MSFIFIKLKKASTNCRPFCLSLFTYLYIKILFTFSFSYTYYYLQEHHRSQEKEIQRASQLCQNELFSTENVATTDVAAELPSLITKLKSSDDQQSSGSSSSGNGSIKSGSGSPRQQQNVGHTKSEPIRKDSDVSSSQQRSTGEADTTNIRLKLGGFSGRSSRYYFVNYYYIFRIKVRVICILLLN